MIMILKSTKDFFTWILTLDRRDQACLGWIKKRMGFLVTLIERRHKHLFGDAPYSSGEAKVIRLLKNIERDVNQLLELLSQYTPTEQPTGGQKLCHEKQSTS